MPPRARIGRIRDCMGVMLVAAAIALFTLPIWAQGRVWALQEVGGCDLFDLNAPLRAELLTALSEGRLPVWTSRLAGGWPLLGEQQIGAYFPLNWIGPAERPLAAVCRTIGFVMLLAGLSAYVLARTLGCSPAGAAIAGATWPLSGLFVSNITHPNMQAAVAMAPLALAFAEQSCRRSGPRRLVWLAPVMSLSFFAGYPQMVYLSALAVAFWLVMRRAGPAHLAWLAVALALTVLLTAPQLVPAWEMTRLSQRAAGLSPEAAAVGSVEPAWLARWLYPWIQGDPGRIGTPFPPEGIFVWTFAGPLPLMALAFALARLRAEPRLARGLLALSATLLVAFGRHTPVHGALRIVPGFALFRFPVRMLFFSELVLALLAGWLVTQGWRRRRWRRPVALAAIGHLAILLAVDLSSAPTLPAADYPPRSSTVDFLARHPGARYASLFGDEAWIEAYVRSGGWKADLWPFLNVHALLRPNVNLLHGLSCIQGYGTLYLPAAHRLIRALELDRPRIEHPPTGVPEPVMRLLRTGATRFVLSVRKLTNEDLREVHATAVPWPGFQVRVYEIADPAPRARFVAGALETTVEPAGGAASRGGVRVDIVDEGPRHVDVEVEAPRAGWLVLADTAYPGWRAFVNGRESAWHATAEGHRAVAVGAGRHGVRYAFSPTHEKVSAGLAVAGLALLVILCFPVMTRVFHVFSTRVWKSVGGAGGER